jgi:hypothetical protein
MTKVKSFLTSHGKAVAQTLTVALSAAYASLVYSSAVFAAADLNQLAPSITNTMGKPLIQIMGAFIPLAAGLHVVHKMFGEGGQGGSKMMVAAEGIGILLAGIGTLVAIASFGSIAGTGLPGAP